ncbi:hypothetical protein TrVFT333_005928 [Trichoderma virens FT-333]|nr:hypothetical protein TrVFT333_005928 [Trichoderma virens FT-333]
MGTFSHVRLVWAALMAGLMTAMADKTLTFPAAFEVDLLFPHNATYAPSPLMPIVFAVQNPNLAKPLKAAIDWTLWEGNNKTSPGAIGSGPILVDFDVASESPTSSFPPLLLSSSVNTIAYPDGVWTLAWNLEYLNCSSVTHSETFFTVFTVSKSGEAPNLVAATSADTCSTLDVQALNVTSLDGVGCSMLAPSPTTNPCAVTIDSAAASSLSALARATGYVCAMNTNLTCPTSFPDSAGIPRMAAESTLLTLLATLTALVHLG